MNELEQRVARAIIDAEENTEGQGAKFIPAAFTQDHSGDCTKDPWTCARCYAEQYIQIAQAALKAHEEYLAEQGFVVVPREPTQAMRKEAYHGAIISWHKMISAALQQEE